MKKLLIGVAALAVVVVGALFLLVGNLDKIIKGALEGVGSELLGTKVTVVSVELDLRSGAGQISGVSIANPPGFSSGNAFQMDMIRLGIDLGSLGAQPLVINELDIQDPVVRVEAREDGSSNLQVLLDNVEKNSARADRKAAEHQPESEAAPKGEPVRISFGRLAITGVKVYASIPGQGPETVVLPDIVMRSVGGEEGLTPAQTGAAVIGKIAVKSLEEVLKKTMAEKIEETGKELLEDMKKRLMPEENE